MIRLLLAAFLTVAVLAGAALWLVRWGRPAERDPLAQVRTIDLGRGARVLPEAKPLPSAPFPDPELEEVVDESLSSTRWAPFVEGAGPQPAEGEAPTDPASDSGRAPPAQPKRRAEAEPEEGAAPLPVATSHEPDPEAGRDLIRRMLALYRKLGASE